MERPAAAACVGRVIFPYSKYFLQTGRSQASGFGASSTTEAYQGRANGANRPELGATELLKIETLHKVNSNTTINI